MGAPALLAFIKSVKLCCIATGTAQRLPQLPDVPTVAEQGFKGFEMTHWYGLMAPSKWPKANIAKLEAAAIKASRSAQVKEKLAQETALAVGGTGAEFDAFIKTEPTRRKAVIARAQIKPDGAWSPAGSAKLALIVSAIIFIAICAVPACANSTFHH